MKWLSATFGGVFLLLSIIFFIAPCRYKKAGQQFIFDEDQHEIIVGPPGNVQAISVDAVVGLQRLSRNNEAQLNLIVKDRQQGSRIWLHTDLAANIDRLVLEFETIVGLTVVSDKQGRGTRS
jgi:hypothetical protein